MRVVRTRAELQQALDRPRRDGLTIGLVPTMGALHAGHRALIGSARERCDLVVATIFVNPTQFSPSEDLGSYPRTPDADHRIAEAEGVEVLYEPPVEDVYPAGFATWVVVEGVSEVLCGAATGRGAEHFRGVTTVVCKLLNRVRPDIAFFGQKDAQQAVVIRRMAADLDIPVEIAVEPTVREADGLALSSRNAYLSPGERDRALGIPRALSRVEELAAGGERDADRALAQARRELEGLEVEYFEARDAEDLSPVSAFGERPVLVALAARAGRARLIDNVTIEPALAGHTGYPAQEGAEELSPVGATQEAR